MDVMILEDIQTFVFLDLETTGLPHLEHKRTRITEIALVSAQRDEILQKSKSIDRRHVRAADLLPRVVNKMNICVYPQKMILPQTTEITGLSNENLQIHKPFDLGLYETLLYFIERLPKPVCLLAQNGCNFDFPILQSEIQKLGKTLPSHVYCADTRYCFKELLKEESCSKTNSDVKSLSENTDSENEMILLIEQIENYEKIEEVDSDTEVVHVDKKSYSTVKKINETTPVRKPLQTARAPLCRKSTSSPNTTPVKSDNRLNTSKATGARKRLPFSENITPLRNYKLGTVYEYLTGRKLENAHMAENDALALLECAVILGDRFIHWTDENKELFNSTVQKLW